MFVCFQERMSLKHKNTGKWAKGQIKFGKYNKEVSYIYILVFSVFSIDGCMIGLFYLEIP